MNYNVNKLCEVLKMPNPWHREKPAVQKDNHGWFGRNNREELERIIKENNIKTVLELGAWLGKSTLFFAERVDFVITVDTWLGSPEHTTPNRTDVFDKLLCLYETFLVNCWDYKHKIFPIRTYTHIAWEFILANNITTDLIYIDAQHSYESCLHDLKKANQMHNNPKICGDDWKWGKEQPIAQAVKDFISKYNYSISVKNNFWEIVK